MMSWIFLYLVGTGFFLTANVFVLFSVLNPGTIKQTLKDENIYAAIVPSALESAAKDARIGGQLSLQAPEVKDAAQTAFPVNDLEQKTGIVIDSTFAWLEGKTEKPEFAIDVKENKERFATEIGSKSQARLDGLPQCSAANLPDSYNPFTINCLPPGFSSVSLSNTLRQQISSDQNFLPDTIISSDDLRVEPAGNTTAQNPLEQLDGMRSLYQQKTLLMWLLPAITLILAVTGLVLASDRAKGLRRLGRSFLFSAISLFIFAILLGSAFERVIAETATDTLTRNVLGPAITSLAGQAQKVYYVFTGIGLFVAIAVFIASSRLPRKN